MTDARTKDTGIEHIQLTKKLLLTADLDPIILDHLGVFAQEFARALRDCGIRSLFVSSPQKHCVPQWVATPPEGAESESHIGAKHGLDPEQLASTSKAGAVSNQERHTSV